MRGVRVDAAEVAGRVRVLRFKKKLVMMAGVLLLPTTALVAVSSGTANAAPYTATGTVTCSDVTGGISFWPPLELPALVLAGPASEKGQVDIHLGGCTSTDATVSFTGLNGNTAIDGDVTGNIVTHSNDVYALANSQLILTTTWYGTGGTSQPLAPTVAHVSGVQAYQGLANDPGNVGLFLGTTTETGTYSEPNNPAGYQSFQTTNPVDMPAFSGTNSCGTTGYAWPCFPTPGGETTVPVAPLPWPLGPYQTLGHTTTLCVSQGDLGAYTYLRSQSAYLGSAGYVIPGITPFPYYSIDSGVEGAVAGNLKGDPIAQGGSLLGSEFYPDNQSMTGDYIASVSTHSLPCDNAYGDALENGQPVTGWGSFTVGNPAGAAYAAISTVRTNVPTFSAMPVGEPLTVSGVPPSMGKQGLTQAALTTDCTAPTPQPGNIVTFEDGVSPDSVCVLKDTGAYVVPGGVGPTAVWVFGSTANDIPPVSTAPTVGLTSAGCTSASLAASPLKMSDTSCDLMYTTGSFAQTAQQATASGDLTTGFSSESDLQGAASGTVNGYGGSDNPDPEGITFMAVNSTDGITL